MLGTVQRAGDVLDLFTVDEPEWGVTSVAAELELSKSTAHTLLASLETIGLLEHAAPSRRYRLGWRTLTLGRTALVSSVFRTAAQRVMRQMAERHGQTMHLAAWDRGGATCVLRSQPASGVRLPVDLTLKSRRVPTHVTAVGKILLASQPDAVIRATTRLAALTTNSITDPEVLKAELGRVRVIGYAHDWEEAFDGVACVAAPITFEGKVVAALSLSADAKLLRRHEGEYATAITHATHMISVGIVEAEAEAEAEDADERPRGARRVAYA